MQLDGDDWLLLRALQDDARRSFRDLAQLTGLSTPTVSVRVKRLEELGLIRGYGVRLDPDLLGRRGLLLDVETRPAAAEAVADALRALPNVEEVLILAGGRLHARAFVTTPEDEAALHAALAGMEEVTRYHAHTILRTRSAAVPAPVGEETPVHVACHHCSGPIHGQGVRKRTADEREHWFCCRNCLRGFEERLEKLQT